MLRCGAGTTPDLVCCNPVPENLHRRAGNSKKSLDGPAQGPYTALRSAALAKGRCSVSGGGAKGCRGDLRAAMIFDIDGNGRELQAAVCRYGGSTLCLWFSFIEHPWISGFGVLPLIWEDMIVQAFFLALGLALLGFGLEF